MKTKFSQDGQNRVTLEYDDFLSGERVTREFFCNPNGGYVRENSGQVCAGLASRGVTLTAPDRANLIDVIRREYRNMRYRANKA